MRRRVLSESPPHLSIVDAAPMRDDGIAVFDAVALLTQLLNHPVSVRSLVSAVARQSGTVGAGQVVSALRQHGFSSQVLRRRLDEIPPLALPAVILLNDDEAYVLTGLGHDGVAEVLIPGQAAHVPIRTSLNLLQAQYSGWVLFASPERHGPEAGADAAREGVGQQRPLSWFWDVIFRFRSYYAETAVAAIVINILGIGMSLFTMNVYDRVMPNQSLESLWVLAIGASVVIGFEFVARSLRSHFLDVAAKKADLAISSQLFRHVLNMRGDAKTGTAGGFASQVQGFEAVREFIGSSAMVAFSDLPFVIVYLTLIWLIGGELAWVALLAFPIVIGAGLLFQLPLNRSIREATAETHSKQGVLVESIEAIDTIKSLNAEGVALGHWERACTQAAQSSHRSRNWSAIAVNFSQFVLQFATIATIVAGIYMIGAGTLTQGALIASVMLCGRALAPLVQVAGLLARYHHAKAAYDGLSQLMKLPTDREPGRHYLNRPHIPGNILFENVKVSYGGQPDAPTVLDIPSLSIKAGERVAILGSVGSGKTTLLRALAGLVKPKGGLLLLDGIDSTQIDPTDVRENIAYVAQEARLFRCSLKDNLLMGAPLASSERMLKYAAICGVHEWATRDKAGYDMHIAEAGVNLSGGQRQMVALARSLTMESSVLLLDEPTSAMDQATERAILTRMAPGLQGRTLIAATHRPALLALVQRVIVMHQGRVLMDGPRDEVLRRLAERGAQEKGAP